MANSFSSTGIPEFKISEEEKTRIKKSAQEDAEKDIIQRVELEWKKETRLTDDDIIEIFPKEQALVAQKLEEYYEEASDLYREMVKIRNIMDTVQSDPFSKWFFVNANRFREGDKLKNIYETIKRLKRLKVAYEKKQVEDLFKFVKFETKEERKKYNTDRMMEKEGLLIDIAAYDGIRLKGTGSRYMGLCPFHTEKTGSWAVYVDNWYHCFGCAAHGNVFNYVMKTRNIDFKEALAIVDRFV